MAGQETLITLAGRGAGTLSYSLVEQPTYGSLTGAPPNLRYTPAPGFTGADTFSFSVSDGLAASRPAYVQITVLPDPADSTPPQVVWIDPPDGTEDLEVSATPGALKGKNLLAEPHCCHHRPEWQCLGSRHLQL